MTTPGENTPVPASDVGLVVLLNAYGAEVSEIGTVVPVEAMMVDAFIKDVVVVACGEDRPVAKAGESVLTAVPAAVVPFTPVGYGILSTTV